MRKIMEAWQSGFNVNLFTLNGRPLHWIQSGGVAERSMALVLKTSWGEIPSKVRILPPPF